MSISGLILFLVSVTYPTWQADKLIHAYYENQRDYEILDVDVKATIRRDERLDHQRDLLKGERLDLSNQMDELEKRIAATTPRSSRATKATVVSDFNHIKEIKSKIDEKDQQLTEASIAETELLTTLQKKNIELLYKARVAVWESRAATAVAILALLGAAAGLFLARKGFNLWSLRVQVFQDEILRNQAGQEAGPIRNPPPISRNRFGFKRWR